MRLIVIIALISVGLSLSAQEIMSLITKHNFINFGEKKLKIPTSVKMSVVIKIKDEQVPATIWIRDNFSYKIEINKPGETTYQILNPMGYNIYSDRQRISENKDIKSPEYQRYQFLIQMNPLINIQSMKRENAMIEFRGDEPVDEIPHATVMLRTLGTDLAHTYYLNRSDMQLSKIKITNSDMDDNAETFYYKNYQKTKEGYAYPSEFSTFFGLATVKSIEFNVKISESEFQPKHQ